MPIRLQRVPMFPSSRQVYFCAALLMCLTAVSLHGQSGRGFSVRERPGIVLVKPQPWSKETEATVFEFQAFIDRTADGASGAGYYEFRTKNGDRRQVPAARIVKLIIYPDVDQFREIVTPGDRHALVACIEELRSAAIRSPSASPYVEPSIAKLSEELARYDSGQVKTEGLWTPREVYVKRTATRLASLMKEDMERARPPSSMDLEDDPRFIALEELGQGNSDAKRLATEVSAQFAGLVRAEKRNDLLITLSRQGTSLPEAEAALKELRALKPDEDPKSAGFVRAWDAGVVTVTAASAEAEEISASIERELASFSQEDTPPEISPEIENQISALNSAITRFLAARPPSQLAGTIQKAAAVGSVGAGFDKLRAIFEEKRYIEAKDVLDDLSRSAAWVGPETVRVVSGLQHQAIEKIEQFTRLRGEAKLLAESGKRPEALAKFEAAYTVIPDSEIGRQISVLKQGASADASRGP
jgi:hypothetical protein